MSLKFAILTQVINKPTSGYDIAKAFETSLGFFWHASHQQIYKNLADMTAEGWLSCELQAQNSKPDKKLYLITTAGSMALRQWVVQPSKTGPNKEAYLVKLLTLELVGSEPLLAEARSMMLASESTLTIYQGIQQQYYPDGHQGTSCLLDKGYFLALRRGITAMEAKIIWLNEVISALDENTEIE